jgi:CheY-like chemotaxis protein/predicted regulator of Ras-like GTPase activity (Roadblock/LC7/MglB family)
MSDTPQSPEPQHLLLVDDEEALVWSLSNRITKLRPHYQVATANDGVAALELIEAAPRTIDLLITDITMPGMSGLELIVAARRAHPRLPVIVITAYPTPDVRQEVALRGSIEYLEKPFEFDRFLAIVDEVLNRKHVGFSGAISVQTLPDIVQLYALSNATGALHVVHHAVDAAIWFERGAIVHAVTPGRTGVDAFYEIMLWSGGEFSMQLGSIAAEKTIRASWTELIMESCRQLDDRRRQIDLGASPNSTRGWSLAPEQTESIDMDFDLQPEPKAEEHIVVDLIVKNPLTHQSKEKHMATVKESLSKLEVVDGFVGAALVDSESGMLLGQEGGGGLNLEIAGASNAEVVRSKRKAIRNLNLRDEVEDILITLGKQYHMIRPMRSKPALFFYVVLDRSRANLAMARMTLAEVEKDIQI